MRIGLGSKELKRQETVMKRLAIVLLGTVALLDGACAPYYYDPSYAAPPGPYAAAPGPYPGPAVSVAVADQPYYVHGPYYWYGGRRWVWAGGHWVRRHGRRVWVHGSYVVP